MKVEGDWHILGKEDRAIPESWRSAPALRIKIWNSKFDRYEDLSAYPNLSELEILGYRANTFMPLGSLRSLRRLFVMDFPKVTSFEPLSGMGQLEELILETAPGSDSSGKRKMVESFRPLSFLTRLRVLKLAGVEAVDHDLSSLRRLTNLQVFAIPNVFPQRQLARLSAALPHLTSGFLSPYLPLDHNDCSKCGMAKVMLSGSDVPNPKVICPNCHQKKFEGTIARFEQYRQEAVEENR